MILKPVNLIVDDIDKDNEPEILMISRRDGWGTSSATAETGRTFIIGTLTTPLEQGGLNVFTQEYIDTSSYLKGGGLYDMKVVDFDGDGKKEIWLYTWDKLTINIYEPTVANLYPHVAEIRMAIPNDYLTPQGDLGSLNGAAFYDVNKDGKLEGYIASLAGEGPNEDGAIVYIKNIDDVSKFDKSKMTSWNDYIKIVGYSKVSEANLRGMCIGDFDKDGKIELAFVDRRWDKVVMMKYNGTGDLADSTSYTWTDLFKDTSSVHLPDYANMSLASSDLDGDGYPELLLPNLGTGSRPPHMLVVLEATKPGSVEKSNSIIPENYSLKQNYPNPFNPETKIEFSIPKSSQVTLKVYNSIGQEVATLVNEQKEAGNYFASFNASSAPGGLPSGTYFYELRAGDFTSKMKMVLVK
jgi:hypothetical protein